MVRISKVEACMICERMPCECNKAAPKPRKQKATATLELSDEDTFLAPIQSRRSALAAMKAVAKPAPVPDSFVVADTLAPEQELQDPAVEKAEFASAIRALAIILHPSERARYGKLLTEKLPLEERRKSWRSKQQLLVKP